MICAKCGWSHSDLYPHLHVCPEAPGLKGSIEAVVPRCPECERLRALCREAADEIWRQCPAHLLAKNPVYERLRKAGGET